MTDIITCEGIDICKRNTCNCWNCKRKIGRGVPRLKVITRYTPHVWKRYLCFRCFDERVKNDIRMVKKELTRLRRLKTQMKRLVAKSQKEIIVENL
jgi:hypothetical protein